MSGYKKLACAVISKAFDDLASRDPKLRRHRDSAVSFLSRPNADLAHWCALADVLMEDVIRAAQMKAAA